MNAKYITTDQMITLPSGKRVRMVTVDVGKMSVKEARECLEHIKKYGQI